MNPADSSGRPSVLRLDGHSLTPVTLWNFARQALDPAATVQIELANGSRERVARAAAVVARLVAAGETVYGINTGFGSFAERAVPPHRLAELQENLIRSHAAGVGEEAPRDVVLAMWLLRLNTMCKGHSGNRLEVMDRAIRLLEAGVLGGVPSRGSVGASGDLAPSAHAVLPLLGEGWCTRPTLQRDAFERVPAGQALSDLGMAPLRLAPKEGLSLINGTQYTTTLAVKSWTQACRLWRAANLTAALTLEAIGGAGSIFEPAVLASHHPETARAGREMAAWLEGSEYLHGARREGRLAQAPYSLRCVPQVHGAVLRELRSGYEVLAGEVHALCDNPLVFPEEGRVYSCGNFHAVYPARVCDGLASALTTLAAMAERRISLAMDGRLSGLPTFLVADGGLNSGLMMAQTTAAALVCEARTLSAPASVDSIPTNCDREDHVSMGPVAGLKVLRVVELVHAVLAIELLTAAQALDLRGRAPVPPRLARVQKALRERVPFLHRDAVLAPLIAACARLLLDGDLLGECDTVCVLGQRGPNPGDSPPC
jgi:histidine ammonia-lyase